MSIKKISVVGSGVAIGQSKTFAIDNVSFEITEAEPNNKNTIAIERSSQRLLNAKIGDALTIETLSGLRRTFTISSIVKDPTAMPGTLTGFATAYISFDTLERIEEPLSAGFPAGRSWCLNSRKFAF